MSLRLATGGDLPFITSAYALAFAFGGRQTQDYIEKVGVEQFYIAEVEGQPAAVLAVIETGHWFGGRIVPACNIAHVAIAPEHRGSGLAGSLLEDACAQAMQRGAAVVTLFASTRPVYRRAGFELAGSEIRYEAETSELYKLKDKLRCRRVTGDALLETIAPIYDMQCETEAGVLARSPAHWRLLLGPGGDAAAAFVFSDGGGDAGYIVLDASNTECLVLRDWVALSGGAARQILKFLGTFSTVYPKVRWHGAPQDALVFAMPDKGWQLAHQEEFLLRVLSVEDALNARGYSCADLRLAIDIVDAGKTRSFALAIHNGVGTCEETMADFPRITIGHAQFATLFSGFRTARFLAKAGLLTGSSDAIRLCDTIFAGPAPWVGEHF